jgi:hypothetical protein
MVVTARCRGTISGVARRWSLVTDNARVSWTTSRTRRDIQGASRRPLTAAEVTFKVDGWVGVCGACVVVRRGRCGAPSPAL